MELRYKNLNSFFDHLLQELECADDTKAYLISLYSKFKSTEYDLSQDSLTLLYSRAKNNRDFLTYQTVGDWLFFICTIHPEHLRYASEDYYHYLGQSSYYQCYRLINKEWKLFNDLSENFIQLETEIKQILTHNPIR